MNNKYFFPILFLAYLVCLMSCKTTEQHYAAGYKKNPVKMAELTRKTFPCITTVSDTTYKVDTLYDMIEVQCPDTISYRVDSFETSVAVRVPVYVKVKVPEMVTKTITIIQKVEDSAKIYSMQDNLTKNDKTINDLTNKVNRKNKKIKWLLIISIGLAAWIFAPILFNKLMSR